MEWVVISGARRATIKAGIRNNTARGEWARGATGRKTGKTQQHMQKTIVSTLTRTKHFDTNVINININNIGILTSK